MVQCVLNQSNTIRLPKTELPEIRGTQSKPMHDTKYYEDT